MNKKIRGIMLAVVYTFSTIAVVHTVFTPGYEVVAEGKSLGFVESAETVDDICDRFDNELFTEYGMDAVINNKITLVKSTNLKNNITDVSELEKNISELSDNLTFGYLLKVDDKVVLAFNSQEEADRALKKIQDRYRIDDGKTEFLEDVKIEKSYCAKSKVYGIDDAVDYLTENNTLSVKTTTNCTYIDVVGFSIIETDDDTMYKGSSEVTQDGEVGEAYIDAEVMYINGEEVGRTIKKRTITKDPIEEHLKIGTLELPNRKNGEYSFINPVSVARISSEYGERWNRLHGGIDLAAPTGTPIVASDMGTVSFVGNSGSYGLLVKIDHGNGYVTYYAHCSEVSVKVGEVVFQGNEIAKVGSTGNSTGPHCHFEVRYNNEQLNPMDFIK